MINIRELRVGNYIIPKNDSGTKSKIGTIFAIYDYFVSVSGNLKKDKR